MVDKNVLALPGARRALALLAVTGLAGALATVGQACFLSGAVVRLWRGEGLDAALVFVAAFAACYLARQVVAYARSSYMDGYARRCAHGLRSSELSRLLGCGPVRAGERGAGDEATLLVEGVERVQAYVGLILPKVADVATVSAVLLAALFALDWVSGVVVLAVLPCTVLFMRLLGLSAKEAAAKRHGEFRRLSGHFIDTVRGIGTLRLFGRSRQAGEGVYAASERFREATVDTLKVATLSSLVLDLFGTFALAAAAIMLGFRLLDGSMALFNALAALVLVPECFAAVRRFASDFHASLDGANALADLVGDAGAGHAADAAGMAVAVEGAARAPEGVTAASEGAPATEGAACAPWGATSTLELRGVGFCYPDEAGAALRGVDLTIRGCAKVGVVGASGAGKSTLVNLLAGFADPVAGSFAVDGAACPSLGEPRWQRQVTYIPQNPYLFRGTLRDNLAFYRPDADDAAIMRAVTAVGLDEALAELPEGLDTRVGEGGRALSGGQAQRVALARALLDDGRRILLLDEPTAHLDIETELALKERMLPFMEGRLVVLATHRLHWVRDMDLVVVLEEGRVVQVGTPAEVQVPGGAYERLAARLRGGEGR